MSMLRAAGSHTLIASGPLALRPRLSTGLPFLFHDLIIPPHPVENVNYLLTCFVEINRKSCIILNFHGNMKKRRKYRPSVPYFQQVSGTEGRQIRQVSYCFNNFFVSCLPLISIISTLRYPFSTVSACIRSTILGKKPSSLSGVSTLIFDNSIVSKAERSTSTG